MIRYRQRISGPLLDRIDLHLDVPTVGTREITIHSTGESPVVIRKSAELPPCPPG